MGLYLIKALLNSLVLTIILEEIFALIIGVRSRKDLCLICLVNIITNPAVVFLYYLTHYYTVWNSIIITIILEGMAILTEAIYYRKYGRLMGGNNLKAFIFSIGANLFSYGSGFLISRIW